MKIICECEYCKKQFGDASICMAHEILHLRGDEEAKYYIRHILNKDLCEYCEHAYYVYGCELACDQNNCNPGNNYQHFKKERLS